MCNSFKSSPGGGASGSTEKPTGLEGRHAPPDPGFHHSCVLAGHGGLAGWHVLAWGHCPRPEGGGTRGIEGGGGGGSLLLAENGRLFYSPTLPRITDVLAGQDGVLDPPLPFAPALEELGRPWEGV